MRNKWLIILPFVMFLASCTGGDALLSRDIPTPVPTDCGCTLEGPGRITEEPGSGFANPVGPGLKGGGGISENTLADYKDRWETYTNPDYQFSFEFPAVYTSPSFKFCAARLDDFPPDNANLALDLGMRTVLTAVRVDDGDSLEKAAQDFRSDSRHVNDTFEEARVRTVAGQPALTLPYRSSGTNRYSEVTFFQHDGMLYSVETGGASACDVPELQLTEMNAYSQMLDSFRFN